MFIKKHNDGGGFDLFEWFNSVLAKIRGMSVTPKVKLKLARFAQGQAMRNFVVRDPYRIKAAAIRLKIPGLHISPKTIQITPRIGTGASAAGAGIMRRNSPMLRERQRLE